MSSKAQHIFRVCLSALLIVFSGACTATSRMGEAQVRELNGQPCFTLATKEFKRGPSTLTGIFVSDETSKPVQEVWAYTITKNEQGIALQSETCVTYGQHPKDAQSKPAEKLVQGRLYDAFLKARSRDTTDPTFGYSVKFCVKKTDKKEEFSVHQILWDEKQGHWDNSVCK